MAYFDKNGRYKGFYLYLPSKVEKVLTSFKIKGGKVYRLPDERQENLVADLTHNLPSLGKLVKLYGEDGTVSEVLAVAMTGEASKKQAAAYRRALMRADNMVKKMQEQNKRRRTNRLLSEVKKARRIMAAARKAGVIKNNDYA